MSKSAGTLQWERSCIAVDQQAGRTVVLRAQRAKGTVLFSRIPSADSLPAEARGKQPLVVSCLPIRESLTRWIEAPFSSPGKAARVFPTLLDIELPFALEDCSFCFIEGDPTGRGSTRALAVAARLESIDAKIASLKQSGVDPAVLDQEGLVLWTQSLREVPPGPGGERLVRAVVSLGVDQWSLVIGRGTEYISAHSVRAGDTAQISRCMRAAIAKKPETGGRKPEGAESPSAEEGMEPATVRTSVAWFWAGPAATDQACVAEIHGKLAGEWPGSSEIHADPDTFLARGIAVRALTAGPMRCNLRAGALTHPALVNRQKSRSLMTAGLFLAAGVVLCAVNLFSQAVARRMELHIDRESSRLASDLAGYPVKAKGADAQKIVQGALEKRMALVRPFATPFNTSLADTVGGVTDIGAKNRLKYYSLLLTGDKVLINGSARDWNSCEKLSAYLTRAGFRARLQRREALPDETIPFTIKAGDVDE